MAEQWELEGGGQLTVRDQGARVLLSVRRPMEKGGLYKAWIRGGQGELLLGTLAPESQVLTLNRTLSRSTLEQAGCWPVTGGRTAMAFSFDGTTEPAARTGWHWSSCPAQRLADPVLAQSAGELGPLLLREDGEGFQLAAPFDPRRTFPLTALFCLAQTAQIDGQTHAVFSFDRQGRPRLP